VCTSPVSSIELALIQLQYALGDYYSCGEQDRELDALDPSLRELRKIAFSAQRAIDFLDAKPKISHKGTPFLHAVGR